MTIEFAVSADGTRLACSRGGSGPPLVFVHGASGDRHANPRLRALLESRYCVTAFDRRGRGDSGDHASYDFLKEADDLRAIVAATKDAPIVLGISMGARIALEMLREPPDLAAMVLFEAPVTDQRNPDFDARLRDVRRELAHNGNEAAVVLHLRLFHRRTPSDIEDLKRDTARWKLRVESFPATLREMEAVHRDCLFLAHRYQRPDFPVHLITGDATLPFLRRSADLIRGLDFVETHLLAGGTHSAPNDDAERVYSVLQHGVIQSESG